MHNLTGRRAQRLLFAPLILVMLALTAASCGSVSRPRAPQPAPEAQQVLRDALITPGSDLPTYDPALATDAASQTISTLIYPTLLALDSQLTTRQWATENTQISADGLTITFALRSGMHFSDGEPINAQTFAYSLNRALDPCVKAPLARYLYAIADALAFNQETCATPAQDGITGPITTLIGIGQPLNPVDPLTLVITLAHPSITLLAALTTPIAAAVPQALAQQYGITGWSAHLMDHGGLGGGLFALTRTPQQGGLRLTRNTAFWGAAPRLREIDYSLFTSTAAAYASYQAGKLDVGYPPTALVPAGAKSSTFQSAPTLDLVYLGINWKSAPFTNQQVRQAFALAIDKQFIASQTLRGLVIATNHIVPQGMPGYNAALVGPDSSQRLTADTAQAVKLAASFASSGCSGSFSLCPAITLEAPAEDAHASEIAADIARMWQAVAPGYPLTVKIEPAALLAQREQNGQAQLTIDDWMADYPDAQVALGRFAPTSPGASGSVNQSDALQLTMTADAEQDPAQRAKDYQAAEQLLVSAVAIVPLYQEQLFWQTPARVQNVIFDPQGRMSIYDTLPSVVIMRTS